MKKENENKTAKTKNENLFFCFFFCFSTKVWALGGLAMKQHQNQSQFVPFVVSLVNLFLCAISAIEILVTWNSSTFKPLLNRKKAE